MNEINKTDQTKQARDMEFVTLVMINLMELFRRKWREC